eukprot:768176-Pyramimonas_sp.AAC.1
MQAGHPSRRTTLRFCSSTTPRLIFFRAWSNVVRMVLNVSAAGASGVMPMHLPRGQDRLYRYAAFLYRSRQARLRKTERKTGSCMVISVLFDQQRSHEQLAKQSWCYTCDKGWLARHYFGFEF